MYVAWNAILVENVFSGFSFTVNTHIFTSHLNKYYQTTIRKEERTNDKQTKDNEEEDFE